MKICVTFILLIALLQEVNAQNLVPNPSFEDILQCPNNAGQITRATNWLNPALLSGSPDLFHVCNDTVSNLFNDMSPPSHIFGAQVPRTGDAYAGFLVANQNSSNNQEYIQVKLLQPLEAGASYCIEFFVSLSDMSPFASDDIGVYFSDTAIKTIVANQPLPVTPQIENPSGNILSDKNFWMPVTGTYVAVGGEQFMTIGNFKTFASTTQMNVGGGALGIFNSYYMIDDITLVSAPKPTLTTDTIKCNETSVTIDAGNSGATYLWYNNEITQQITIDTPGIYSVQITNSCGIVLDVFTIIQDTVCPDTTNNNNNTNNIDTTTILDTITAIYVPNAFTPNGDGINDVLYVRPITISSSNLESFIFRIYNRWGRKVFESKSINIGWDGTAKGELQNEGVYSYLIEVGDGEAGKSTLIQKGNVTLLR